MYRGSGVNLLLITPEKAIKLVANDAFRYSLKSKYDCTMGHYVCLIDSVYMFDFIIKRWILAGLSTSLGWCRYL
jgi:hypothetical protein